LGPFPGWTGGMGLAVLGLVGCRAYVGGRALHQAFSNAAIRRSDDLRCAQAIPLFNGSVAALRRVVRPSPGK